MPETMMTTNATTALRLALAVLPKPDHTGAIEGEPRFLPLALDQNDCACDLHKAHVAVRAAIAEAEAEAKVQAQRAARRLEIQGATYPELDAIAERIADEACFTIDRAAARVESAMPYKAQATLESLIRILESRV